jgi:uncharacterized membrane-anchored protein YhcB (DUF1043 family)
LDPSDIIAPVTFLATVGIVAGVVVKIVRLRAARSELPSADVSARLETLESDVQRLQQDLVETQERLDFTERVLGKAREERRIGS